MRRHVLGKEMIQYFLKYKAEACRPYYITEQLKSVLALQKKKKKLKSVPELLATRNQIAC